MQSVANLVPNVVQTQNANHRAENEGVAKNIFCQEIDYHYSCERDVVKHLKLYLTCSKFYF